MGQNQDQIQPTAIKHEPQLCDILDDANIDDEKEGRYTVHGIWEAHESDNGIDMHEDLQHDELEI